jgi:hypothetical protein
MTIPASILKRVDRALFASEAEHDHDSFVADAVSSNLISETIKNPFELKTQLEIEQIIDSKGILIQSIKDKALPNLEDNQHDLIQKLFEQPFHISAGHYQGIVALNSLLNDINEFFKQRKLNRPKIEIIGGYVRWLALQNLLYCQKVLTLLGFQNADKAITQDFLNQLAFYPPDYDIRVHVSEASNEDINTLMGIVVGHMAQQIPNPDKSELKRLIYQSGLIKKRLFIDKHIQYGVISFGSCERGSSLELLFIKKLKRDFLFTHTTPKLSYENKQWRISTSGDFGGQALVDILTQQIHAISPETIDRSGWALYHSYMTKGYTCADSSLDSILFSNTTGEDEKLESSPSAPMVRAIESLHRCLHNHHSNRFLDYMALLINAYPSNKDMISDLWKKRVELTYSLVPEEKNHPLWILSETANELSLPFEFAYAFLQVAAVLKVSAAQQQKDHIRALLINHKKTLALRMSFQKNLHVILPCIPMEAFQGLMTHFPQKLEKNQQAKLQQLIESFFQWDFFENLNPLDWNPVEQVQKSFELLECKEWALRRIGYQLLMHSSKGMLELKILRQL